MLTLFRRLTSRRAALVIVDDLPWIDAASARMLSFALRRLREEPVGLLAAVRTDWSADPRPMATERAPAARVDRIRLRPLSLGATRELLATRTAFSPGRSLLLQIHDKSGGTRSSRWNWRPEPTPTACRACWIRSACPIRCGVWCSSGSRSCRLGHAMCSWSASCRRKRHCWPSALPRATRPPPIPISKSGSERGC